MKHTRFFAIFLCLCLLLTACGASAPAEDFNSKYESNMAPGGAVLDRVESPVETAPAGELTSDSLSLGDAAQTDRKLIKTVTMDAETEHYDELIPALDSKITALGGYVEFRETGSFSRSRRWSRMTIRIPAESLSQFTAHVGENANVLSTSENTQDVTLHYADTEAKITALKTEQTRLLELLSNANNISEILEIEARLSDVTYELERYESQKLSYDNRIVYATITLHIQEVLTLTPMEEPSVWTRIRDGFLDSLEGVSDGLVNCFVFLVAGSPYLVVYGIVLVLLVLLLRKLGIKGRKRKHTPPTDTP